MLGKNRVVITGIGVLAANGIGKEAFWNSLLAGESGIGPITLFDASQLPCRIAGEVPGFDPNTFFDPRMKIKRSGRFTQLALVAFKQAIDDAGIELESLQRIPNLPIVLGVSTTAMDLRALPATSYSAVTGIPNAASSTIAYTYGLSAQILTVSNGCASSLDAITLGYEMISKGKADLVIAGGSDSTITEYVFECMCKSRKLSVLNDDPAHSCRPFDLNRTGGVAAEGAGIVILENLTHASERGKDSYCEILGYGQCIDPLASAEAAGLEMSMQIAIENANVHKNSIEFISAHGPGDPHLDITETETIKSVFGLRAYSIPVTSIKGSCGNPMGAGGVLQLISTALSIHRKTIPPTTNYSCPDPDCDLNYVPTTAQYTLIEAALVNSHGFGRSNTSMILGNRQQ